MTVRLQQQRLDLAVAQATVEHRCTVAASWLDAYCANTVPIESVVMSSNDIPDRSMVSSPAMEILAVGLECCTYFRTEPVAGSGGFVPVVRRRQWQNR
jgi:hypothetical protein